MSKIALSSIRVDGDIQARAATEQTTVTEYSAAMLDGADFPPIVVFFDGVDHWLADGFHRVAAARGAGMAELMADVREGSKRDAVLFAVGANATHGLRRTNADKRRAVDVLLADAEWSKWSDRKIAKACGVTHPFVAKLREERSGNGYHDQQLVERYEAAGRVEQDALAERAEAGREKALLVQEHGRVLVDAHRVVAQFNPRPGVLLTSYQMRSGADALETPWNSGKAWKLAQVVMADTGDDTTEYYWLSVCQFYDGDDAGGNEAWQSKPVRKDYIETALMHMGFHELCAARWVEQPHEPARTLPFGDRKPHWKAS